MADRAERFFAMVIPEQHGGGPACDPLRTSGARGLLYLPPAAEPGLGSLEHALVKCKLALAIEGKIRAAIRKGVIDRAPGEALADVALPAGVIKPEERARIREADEAREEVIQVGSFGLEAPALANSRKAAVR